MRFRKLRIAFSATCLIACVLLIVLWVRSYWGSEQPPKNRMAHDFLTMWRASRLSVESEGHPLDHAAGDQYQTVAIGDTIWFVSVRAGTLELYGRIVVGQITDQTGACRTLGTDDLIQAKYHILPVEGTSLPLVIRDIHHLSTLLRFADSGPDRLVIEPNGLVTAYQLLPLRTLSSESASLLTRALEQ
jgi:hypothetical protein